MHNRNVLKGLQLCAALALTGVFTKAADGNFETTTQELVRVEKEWNDAWINADLKKLDRILADDLLFVGSEGAVSTKETYLANIKSGDDKMFSGTLDQFKVRVLGDTAVVNVRWTGKEVFKGMDVSGRYRATDTWTKRNGQWQLVASHNTKMDAETSAADAKQQLMRLENEWNEGLIKADYKAMERIMAEDYVGTGPDGVVTFGRAGLFEELRAGSYAVISATTDDFTVRLHGNAAVVSLRWAAKERIKGKETSGEYRSTDIWVKENDQWKVVSSHFSKIEAPDSKAAEAEAKQAVLKLENEWDEALLKVDLKTLDRIYADDLILTSSDGEMASKAKAIADLRSGEDVITAASADQYQVKVNGDVAVVSSRWTCKEQFHGIDISGTYRYTDTWIKRDGNWQLLASHGCKLEDSVPRSNEVKNEITSLYHEWDRAEMNVDLKVLDQIIGDDYVGTSPEGEVFAKKDVIDGLKSGDDFIATAFTDDLKINVIGNVAWVVGRYAQKGSTKGKDTSGVGPFTDVLVKRDGHWEVVADQWTKFGPTTTGNGADESTREIINFENESNAAITKGDTDFLDKALADEYLSTGSDGTVYGKKDSLEALNSGDDVVTAAVSDDFKVQFFGSLAVVNARWIGKETYKGKDIGGAYRYTDVLIKRDGRWQALATHSCKILPADPMSKPSAALEKASN